MAYVALSIARDGTEGAICTVVDRVVYFALRETGTAKAKVNSDEEAGAQFELIEIEATP
jgi:hypothetical protein